MHEKRIWRQKTSAVDKFMQNLHCIRPVMNACLVADCGDFRDASSGDGTPGHGQKSDADSCDSIGATPHGEGLTAGPRT